MRGGGVSFSSLDEPAISFTESASSLANGTDSSEPLWTPESATDNGCDSWDVRSGADSMAAANSCDTDVVELIAMSNTYRTQTALTTAFVCVSFCELLLLFSQRQGTK